MTGIEITIGPSVLEGTGRLLMAGTQPPASAPSTMSLIKRLVALGEPLMHVDIGRLSLLPWAELVVCHPNAGSYGSYVISAINGYQSRFFRLTVARRDSGVEVVGSTYGWDRGTAVDPISWSCECRDGGTVFVWGFRRGESRYQIEAIEIGANCWRGRCLKGTMDPKPEGASLTAPGSKFEVVREHDGFVQAQQVFDALAVWFMPPGPDCPCPDRYPDSRLRSWPPGPAVPAHPR